MCTERYHFVAFGCMKIPNFVRDRRTTMTVSVTQEQMQQNMFHHTLTAYMVGYAQEKELWIENMADESVK